MGALDRAIEGELRREQDGLRLRVSTLEKARDFWRLRARDMDVVRHDLGLPAEADLGDIRSSIRELQRWKRGGPRS